MAPPTPGAERGAPPPPARVRHNDWTAVALPPADAFSPTLAVSVVIPCFDSAGPLALALAALERQDWPRDLLEVVLVDDGSRPPLARPGGLPFAVELVRREDRGFTLAAARNAGADAASGDILVFLDPDLIAEAGLVAAHARWHHAVGDALTIGFRACVSAAGIGPRAIRERPGTVGDLLAGRPRDPPWQERLMAATADLTVPREDLFRAASGNNLGIGRALFGETGGFDESFTRYGGEDTEFAWRVQVRGGLLVPVREAFAWHQGRWGENRAAKRRDLGRQREKLAGLIAAPGFRRAAGGRRHGVAGHRVAGHFVARHAVHLDPAEAPPGRVVRAVRDLLAEAGGDVAVCVGAPPDTDPEVIAGLGDAFGGDSRVRVVRLARVVRPVREAAGHPTLEAFPHSPLHMALPAASVRPGVVADLAAALGRRVAATVILEDGAEASVARAWALHRARRAGAGPAEFGETGRSVLGPPPVLRRLGRRVAALARRALPDPGAVPRLGAPAWARNAAADLARVLDEARHVRSGAAALRFLRWAWAALAWRLRHGR